MRFMVLVKGDARTEAGVMPTEDELGAMCAFNEELIKAAAMLAGDGLHPTSKGAKIRYGADGPKVIDGPFTEAKEIVAGYWIIEVKSRDEAIAWLRRAPFPDGEIEIRQIFELSDFAPGPAIDKHQELAAQLAAKQ